MTIAHHDFTIARTYPHAPERVFEAWADRATKALWFGNTENIKTENLEFDFRVGGRERARTGRVEGFSTTFDAVYADIVPNERIVYVYNMTLDDAPLSASAACVTFEPVEGGTLLTISEHGIHLDGPSGGASREEGTNGLADALGRVLDSLN